MIGDGKLTVHIADQLALQMIAGRGDCPSGSHRPAGSCFTGPDPRHPLAVYTDDQPCDACLAWLALNGPVEIEPTQRHH